MEPWIKAEPSQTSDIPAIHPSGHNSVFSVGFPYAVWQRRGHGEVKGRMAATASSAPPCSPGAQPWRQAGPAHSPPTAKNSRAAVVSRSGESEEQSLSQWGIGLRRLSSEGAHYFWANYLEPRVNKQPASVKAALCSRLLSSDSCPLLVVAFVAGASKVVTSKPV